MRETVLWRKISRIIMLLAEQTGNAPEEAMRLFYSTDTARRLRDERYGLYLMDDRYILEDVLTDLHYIQLLKT